MARDYRHRAQPRRQRPPTPGWVWLLAGVLLGAFGMGLAWLRLSPPEEGSTWIGAPPPKRPAAPPATSPGPAPGPAAPRPRFDFFTLLPKMEVVVPEEELEPETPERADRPQPRAAGVRYLLQVGSFRNPGDADRLKARLALLGLEAQVVEARSAKGGVWHRVRTGPYATTQALKRARARLASNGFQSLVIRVRGE